MLQSLPESWQRFVNHELLPNLALGATRPSTRIYTIKYREFQLTAFLHVVCGRCSFSEVLLKRYQPVLGFIGSPKCGPSTVTKYQGFCN